ncbi:MAG: hypothetical protein ACREDV_11805, partial [Methylocella sp.]
NKDPEKSAKDGAKKGASGDRDFQFWASHFPNVGLLSLRGAYGFPNTCVSGMKLIPKVFIFGHIRR